MRKIALIYLVALVGLNCKKNGTDNQNQSNATVYVAGNDRVGSKYVAKLWVNGTPTALTNGSNNAMAWSVFVSGNDVYVAGYDNNGTKDVAKLWKNGASTSLTNGTQNADARSVYVSGNDVYVVGYENNGTNDVAKLWKNGIATSLTTGSYDAQARAVFVLGSDVYIAGYEDKSGGISNAKIWKNGVPTSLTTTTHSQAYSVYVNGSDVHAAGIEYTGVGFTDPRYWKNTTMTVLPSQTNVNSVTGSGSDIYMVGTNHLSLIRKVSLWKNGLPTMITDGTRDAIGLGIFIHGTDVYVSGCEKQVGYVPKYWKNGVAVTLLFSAIDGYAEGIFVK